MDTFVKNVIDPRMSGYIEREELLTFLQEEFGACDFKLRVSVPPVRR